VSAPHSSWPPVVHRMLAAVALLGLSAAVASAQLPTLSIAGCGEATGIRESRICLPVPLTTAGADVASLGFTLEYDPQALRLPGEGTDVEAGSALQGGQSVTAIVHENGTGSVQVAVTVPSQIPIPTISDGDVVLVCFTVRNSASDGCSPIAFTPGSLEMGDDSGFALEIDPPTDGGLTVTRSSYGRRVGSE
jgi:hypothetical protein